MNPCYVMSSLDIQLVISTVTMDWLSRKLVLWQIKKYFHLENEQQVQVQVLGEHSITCSNLKLRNSVVNTPAVKLHIQQLTIKSLSITYSSTGEEPLKVSLDGAQLVLAFNPAYKAEAPSYAKTKQQLREFMNAIRSKQPLNHRGFFSQEVYQLKKLVGEFFIKKVSLLIKHVDVSIQFGSEGEVHAVGCELGEVNIKQRVVIDHEDNERENKEEEVICSLGEVSLYLGISSEEDKIEQLAYNREILRKTRTIRKNRLLEHEQIQIFYNINKNALTLTLPQLTFRTNKLLLVQLIHSLNYIQQHLSDRPLLRPGKGDLKDVSWGSLSGQVREGTTQWWSWAMHRVMERVQEKKQFNILTNYRYRLYLFFLIYRFTFGQHAFVQRSIAEYEEKNLAHSVMTAHSMVLTRIDAIRKGEDDSQMTYFINFICGSRMVQQVCQKNGLKQPNFQKIRTSKVYFNLANCNEFIRDATYKSNMSIALTLQRNLRLEVSQSKYDQQILKDGFALDSLDFYSVKRKYITKYYKRMTQDNLKWDRPFLAIEVGKLQFIQSKTQTRFAIPAMFVLGQRDEILARIQNIVFLKENKTIYTASNKVIIAEKNNYLKISSIFLNVDKILAQHLLTIKVLLSEHAVQPLTEQQQFDNYLQDNIYKRLPKHPYFQSFSEQTNNIEIKKCLIVSSLFQDGQVAAIELNSIDYNSPASSKPSRVTLQKLSVSRGKLKNSQKLKTSKGEATVQAESVIVQNNKPLGLTSSKYLRRHNIETNEKQHNSYIYYQSVLQIVIPFILVQISFQDIYYLKLAGIYWQELLSNDHFFPKRRSKTQTDMRVLQIKQHKIDYFQMLHSFTKSSRTRVKLEGIELLLYGDNERTSHNELLTMLIQGILYENKVYILSVDTNISVYNIFIENCLGKKTFNQLKLAEIIEKRPPTQQPLIYDNKYQSDRPGTLLLYGLNEGERNDEHEQAHMMRLKLKNTFSLKKFRKNVNVYIVLKPLFLYHSSDYYQILVKSFGLINKTTLKSFKPSLPAKKQKSGQSGEHQILQAKNISEKMMLVCELQKINLIALHQNEPIYTFSFLNLALKHETQAYVTKYQVRVGQFYVVDISINCGLHPIVIKAVPLQIYFTKYESELLRRKEKKSALLKVKLHNSEIYYLNRKIMELTNFIMSHFQSSQEEEKEENKKKEEDMPKSYPFCYRVEFIKPVLMLLRNSLSQEKMVSEVQKLLVANYLQATQQELSDQFFFDASRQRINNDSFQSCMEIRQQEIQFHSFAKGDEGEDDVLPTSQIHINLLNFYVYSQQDQREQVLLFTPEIVVTFANKHLKASLKTMNINFTTDDYRILIRITEDNFSETPVSYPKENSQSQYKNVGFKTSYAVEELTMTLRQQIKSQKFGQLKLTNILGTNIIYTNGEKEDIITIDSLQYQSCINNNLEYIILKKQSKKDARSVLTEVPKREDLSDKKIERSLIIKLFADKLTQETLNTETEKKFFDDASAFDFSFISKHQGKKDEMRIDKSENKKEETNLNRVIKWIGGMCKKCMCCCNNEAHHQDTEHNQTDKHNKRDQFEDSAQIPMFPSGKSNLNQSNIQNSREIINFSTKVNPREYKQHLKEAYCVFMHIKGQRSREKRMYMLVQHLDIYYQKNMHIMTLINFLNKPYSQPEKPAYIREAKFNNFRPFQMLIELAHTSVNVLHKEALSERNLQLDLHCFYNLQKIGDPVNGPGKKLMETDLHFQMFFEDRLAPKRTALSDTIRLIHAKQSRVSYRNRKPVKNFEKLLLVSGNPHSKQKTVKFNFPIYIIKSLLDLLNSLKSKPKNQPPKPVEVQNKSVPPMTNKSSLQYQIEIRRTGKNMAQENEIRQKAVVQKKANEVVVNNITFKKFYIPSIQINIETKQTVSFVTILLQDMHLTNTSLSKQKCETMDQVIDVDLSVNYWNLSLGKFEPFLEKCKFKVQQQSLKKQNSENSKLKVITKSEKDSNSHEYRTGLSINLTTAFFHTYKQLQLKYLLQDQKLEISNQICYDLTKRDTKVYEYMQLKKKYDQGLRQSETFLKKFPQELKNFLGRQFKIEDVNELNKKKSKRSQLIKNRFHLQGVKVFLYHSYLEPYSKLKFIIYRTPFRIYNTMQHHIALNIEYPTRGSQLNQNERTRSGYGLKLSPREYYSIPEDIYQSDFLVHIAVNRKKIHEQQIGKGKNIPKKYQKTMSMKYLIQMNANRSEYHQLGKHKLNEFIFNLSSLQKRWIDRRDTLITSQGLSLSLINVKSQCQQLKEKVVDGAKIMLYDSLTIIISPIIVFNYTSQTFNLTNCKQNKYELSPSKSIQLNEFPPNIKISDVFVEFLEDPVHHQYDFLRRNIGIATETMLIERNQSVNIRTIKQTYNTCLVEIYPDWLITNQTELEFHLLYEHKEFIINEKSTNSLAIDHRNNNSGLNMKIKLIDDNNSNEQFHKFGTEAGLIDIFTLAKVHPSDVRKIKHQLKQQRGCCGRIKHKQLLAAPEKAGDDRVFKCVELVINIEQSANYILTKNLTINYKYWLVNQMEYDMVIYQYALGKSVQVGGEDENGIEVVRLKPTQQNYLFTYDFLPKQFYIKVHFKDNEQIYSNLFPCDEAMGRSLSLKLKKNLNNEGIGINLAYHESFHHIRIDMEQIKYTNILSFTMIDGQRTKYPFYINNATNYFVKIKQNGENFKVRPKTRVPFSWSNLVDNTHEIEVEIQGQTKVYSLKEKAYQFEPITIKSDNIAQKTSKLITNKALFKREQCPIKWKGLCTNCLLIFDIFAKKLHVNSQEPFTLLMSEAQRLVSTPNKIQIYFKNREVFQFQPAQQNLKEWADMLRNFLNSNVIDKIYFTIQSFGNSMIYFIHNLEMSEDNSVRSDHTEISVQNFYLSIINSNPLRIEEIMLINMEGVEWINENRLCEMKEEERETYFVRKAQQTVRIKKFKINNQLKHALNPVILSQIKKSNYPFLEIKMDEQNLTLSREKKQNSESIQHYKSIIYFLDEAELIIEAALIPQLLGFKKNLDQINGQYSYKQDESIPISKPQKKAVNRQIYIDYLQIKPIKMTISVSFDANIDKQFQPKLMNFLTMIPAGVQNAIITIDSFMFHHVFMERSRLDQTLSQYYIYEMKKQILFNAGSIKILTPLQLIRGLGIGVTSIFYNPFYQLVNTKEIKSFTTNFLNGFITFIIFIFQLAFSVINGLFKSIAVLTQDNNFQTRREKFRNQIFKSPVDGFTYGTKYFGRIFKEFFINFVTWPCEYNSKAPCIGLLFGLILSILYIVIWIIKLVVTLYDFFYVIGLGFLSWGFYEQNSMKYRTRPIRTFPHKQLLPYNYLTSKGNQIMRRNLIEQNDNEQISFISHIEAGDQSKYLLLSNYRILYCSHELTSFKEITLYKISRVVVGPLRKNQRNGQIENLYIHVYLTFPNQQKLLCFDCATSSYELKFKDLRSIKEFLIKLKENLDKERIDFSLQDENLKKYQKSIENQSNNKRYESRMVKSSKKDQEIPISLSKTLE